MNTIETAYQHCEQMAKSHYENFPVGSMLIPKKQRPHVWAVYAFARGGDDFADENYPSRKNFLNLEEWRNEIKKGEEKRLLQLKEWNDQLIACYQSTPTNPIFIALQKTIQDLKIPYQLLRDLLIAFEQDVVKRRYQNWEEILHYCKHSANPVGRLVLIVFGYHDEKLFELSDAICTALQLANFWQDVAVDLEKDRVYIPLDLLKKYEISEESLFESDVIPAKAGIPRLHFGDSYLRRNDKIKNILDELGKFTLSLFQKGKPLPKSVKGRLSWELKCTWLGGMTILKRSCFDEKREGFERPKISGKDKLKILLSSIFHDS